MKEGLVLSGGGGKGAYQIGAVRALYEAGFQPQYVAGTSIGALNGALLVQGGIERAERCWREIGAEKIIRLDVKKMLRSLALLLLTVLPTPKGRLRGAQAALRAAEVVISLIEARTLLGTLVREGLLQTEGIVTLLDRYLDYEAICQAPAALFVCVYQNDPLLTFSRGFTVYHRARSLDGWTLRNFLFASVAIPVLFPAMQAGHTLLHDGGVGDNTPIRPVAEHCPDRIVVIYLQEGARTNPSHYRGMDILDVTPSRPLGSFPFSTMKFTPNSIADLLELGYQNAREALSKSFSVHK